MRYDLKCIECNTTYYIVCTLKEREEIKDCHDLVDKLQRNRQITQQYENMPIEKLWRSYDQYDGVEALHKCHGLLEVDFVTQKPIRHNINWPKTEDMK